MPKAIAVPVRQQIIELHQQGKSYREVGEALGYSRHSVRQICRSWHRGGQSAASLEPKYGRCGRRGEQSDPLVRRAAVYLKRLHQSWGGGYIRVQLQQRWPERAVPSSRTLQRWFAQAGVSTQPYRSVTVHLECRTRATEAHQCWQVDAVSHQRLKSGKKASWVSTSDEASGAVLAGSVFPLRQLRSCPSYDCAADAAAVV